AQRVLQLGGARVERAGSLGRCPTACAYGIAGPTTPLAQAEISALAGISLLLFPLQVRAACRFSRRNSWPDLLRVSGHPVFPHQGEALREQSCRHADRGCERGLCAGLAALQIVATAPSSRA